jgi:hypothetical protein
LRIATRSLATVTALLTFTVAAPLTAQAAGSMVPGDWIKGPSNERTEFVDGTLKLRGSVFTANAPSSTDVSVEVDALLVDDQPTDPYPPGGVGIWFRTSGGGTATPTGLLFLVDSARIKDGSSQYDIVYVENGVEKCWADMRPIPAGEFDPAAKHRIKLTSLGNGITVEIDGKQVYVSTDLATSLATPGWSGCAGKPLPTGTQVGFRAWNGGTHGQFGNVQVTDLSVKPNRAPIVSTAATGSSVDEGGSATVTGAFTDPDGDSLSLTADTSAGFRDNGDGTWSYTVDSSTPTSSVVTVTAGDSDGATASDSFTSVVRNLEPIADLTLTPTIPQACSVDVVTTATDAGVGLAQAAVDFGDGTVVNAVPGEVIRHAYGAAGTYQVRAIADDGEGAVTTVVSDIVVRNSATALLQPVNNVSAGAPLSRFKLGSTVPLKIKITDCSGNSVPGLTPEVSHRAGSYSQDGVVDESTPALTPTAGSTMRYDATSGQYIYNLSTKGLALGDLKIIIADPSLAKPVTGWINLR